MGGEVSMGSLEENEPGFPPEGLSRYLGRHAVRQAEHAGQHMSEQTGLKLAPVSEDLGKQVDLSRLRGARLIDSFSLKREEPDCVNIYRGAEGGGEGSHLDGSVIPDRMKG